jgi:hypothetical protein
MVVEWPVRAMVARTAAAIPDGERWSYEPKFDGFRRIALRRPDGRVQLQSRQQRVLTPSFSDVVDAVAARLPVGTVVDGDIARQIRRYRPEVLVTATYELTYGLAAGQRILNQADHRAVGVAVLDAARDAGNRWIFPELLDEGHEPWAGVRHVYVMGANDPTHAVDVTDQLEAGVASLRAHEAYLRGLGRDFDPEEFVGGLTAMAGPAIGVRHAVAFGQIQLQGV